MVLQRDHYYKDNLEPMTLYMISAWDKSKKLFHKLFRTKQDGKRKNNSYTLNHSNELNFFLGVDFKQECSTKYGD